MSDGDGRGRRKSRGERFLLATFDRVQGLEGGGSLPRFTHLLASRAHVTRHISPDRKTAGAGGMLNGMNGHAQYAGTSYDKVPFQGAYAAESYPYNNGHQDAQSSEEDLLDMLFSDDDDELAQYRAAGIRPIFIPATPITSRSASASPARTLDLDLTSPSPLPSRDEVFNVSPVISPRPAESPRPSPKPGRQRQAVTVVDEENTTTIDEELTTSTSHVLPSFTKPKRTRRYDTRPKRRQDDHREQQTTTYWEEGLIPDSSDQPTTSTSRPHHVRFADEQPTAMHGANSLHAELIEHLNFSDYESMHDQVHNLNRRYEESRAARIRAAMFPETFEEPDSAYYGGAGELGESSYVMRMAPASQLLKVAVMNLINYQDDAELAQRAIPELIKLLQDDNKVIVSQATMMVNELTKRESSRHALVKTNELVEAVVRVMERTNDPDTAKNAAGSLFHLSQHPLGLMAIFRTGGIPALIKMLYSPIDAVLFYAITTLHNLLMHQEGSKPEIRKHKGIPAMCSLVKRQHEKFLAILMDCLHYLAAQSDPSKEEMLNLGATVACLEVMRQSQYEKLLYTASRLIKVLSVCPQNKSVIVHHRGVQVVQKHLRNPSARLVRNCLWSIRNLSDAATKEEHVEELLRVLVQLLNSPDREIVCCCCGILSNLTCNNQRNKQTLCANGVIDVLLRILEVHSVNVEISEPALCALRHLTSRHELTIQALNAVRTSNGLPIICQLLGGMRPPVVKAALGLIRNLATLPANLGPLRDQRDRPDGKDMVALTAQVLNHAFATIREAQTQGQPSMPVVEGVSMLELVEVSTAALHQLAKDPLARQQIIQSNLIGIFVHLLSYEHENTQRASTGVLNELAQEPAGVRQIEAEGATAILTELLHSRVEAIATYAGAILYKLSKDKPVDYRQQLDLQMQSALSHRASPWLQDGMSDMNAMPNDDMFQDMMYGNQAFEYSGEMSAMNLHDGPGGPGHQMPGTWTSAGPPTHPMHQPGGWYDTDL